MWSVWRNCLLAKKKKKIFSRQPRFFVLEGMQGGTLGCWRRRSSTLARGPECRVTRYENDFSGFLGEAKRKSLVRCYGTFSSRRDGAKTLSCIETYFSSVPGYKTPLLIPRCSSQGHFFVPRALFLPILSVSILLNDELAAFLITFYHLGSSAVLHLCKVSPGRDFGTGSHIVSQ